MSDVHRQLQGGRELNSALARHPKVFSPLFVSLVRVGENTGRLDEAFAHLADYLEVEKNTRERIASAVRYPLVVFAAILVALTIMNIWVIPDLRRRLRPLQRRAAVDDAHPDRLIGFFVTYWPWFLIALRGRPVFLSRWIRARRAVRWSGRASCCMHRSSAISSARPYSAVSPSRWR